MSNNHLPTLYQSYIHKSRYARWLWDKNRRESWEETVARYFDFFEEHLKTNNNYVLTKEERKYLEDAILSLKVMPSMRCLMAAGEALARENVAGYNCSYVAVDSPRSFDEILYILMNGTGVGFSVEQKYVDKLPQVNEDFNDSDTTIIVNDSKLGWAKALKELIHLLYSGQIPKWDVTKVRSAGAPLKTFGGRASGPGPLVDLFEFTVSIFRKSAGRKLTTLECHDLVCKIAEVVVVGGVRRCIPGTALVHTDKGLKAISDLMIGDMVQSEKNQYKKVLFKSATGKKKTLKITTVAGNLICTPEHRVAVLNDLDGNYSWKEAADLVPGDALIYSNSGIDGAETTIPTWSYVKPKHSTTSKNINVNNLSTEEWSWFLGFLHGDGCVHKNLREVTFAVSKDMPETKDKIIDYANRIGVNVKYDALIEEGCWKLRIKSNQLAKFLSQFKMSHTELVIPSFVLEGLKETRLAYIAGILDSDGSCKTKRPTRKPLVIVTSVYPSWTKQISSVLNSLGIYNKETRKAKQQESWKDQYQIDVVSARKKDELALQLSPFSEKIRNDYNFTVSKKEQYSLTVPKNLRKDLPCKDADVVSWESIRSGNEWFSPMVVKEVSFDAEGVTYDIQVEDTESFVVNGLLVHNSALISLSDLSDDRMRSAKAGDWWNNNVQRALANNSFVIKEKMDIGIFMKEWLSLYESKSGERGIFSRPASKKNIEKYGRRDPNHEWGTNPCSEIVLRNREFCNLTEVIIRAADSQKSLVEKVKIGAILGTLQSTLTNFRYISKRWKENCDEERLLGVSLTGIMDCELTNGRKGDLPKLLETLRLTALETNREWALKLGIPASAAITCIKPSGTISQLVDSASGIHTRHSPYYIRTIRGDKKDPLAKLMIETGFPVEDDVTKPDHTYVFSFPIKAPEGSVCREDMSAIDQLEIWLTYQRHYCEHKPSVTISVREEEWMKVGAWVYEHIDEVSGISFLPFSDHTYRQAPYQDCTKEEYEALLAKMPKDIDWTQLAKYEVSDETIGSQELACAAGGCEI